MTTKLVIPDDGEKVTVRFRDQEVSTTAKDGRWSIRLVRIGQRRLEPATLADGAA